MSKTFILVQDSSCFFMLFPSSFSRVHGFSCCQDVRGHGLKTHLILNLKSSSKVFNYSACIKTKLCQPKGSYDKTITEFLE